MRFDDEVITITVAARIGAVAARVARGARARSMTSPRSRTVVVSFLGAIVRRMGNWMPIAGTVGLLGEVGLDGPSVRTAVFRLKKRGWLEPDTRDGRRGYALTPSALDALAAGDELIWHAREPARLHDGWCVVTFSIPESDRTRRHQLRSRLASIGFGNAGAGVWLAPARMQIAVQQMIAELDLTERCAVFVGAYARGQDLTALLHRAWDLSGIDKRYREFIDRHGGAQQRATVGPEAFEHYLAVVDEWRQLPFRDPGLPPELLAPDWSAPDAAVLFERMVLRLEKPALRYAASRWAAG